MRCPTCSSEECSSLSLVYAGGLSDIRTRSRGRGFAFGETTGALSFTARSRGTCQTRLSKLAAPPRKLRYRHVVLWWILGLGILYWLFGYLVWLHELSAIRAVTAFPKFAHAYSGIAVFVLAVLRWHNRHVRPQRYRRWERSFMCGRCGAIFQPFEQQEAA
jgi:hypothetical protein